MKEAAHFDEWPILGSDGDRCFITQAACLGTLGPEWRAQPQAGSRAYFRRRHLCGVSAAQKRRSTCSNTLQAFVAPTSFGTVFPYRCLARAEARENAPRGILRA